MNDRNSYGDWVLPIQNWAFRIHNYLDLKGTSSLWHDLTKLSHFFKPQFMIVLYNNAYLKYYFCNLCLDFHFQIEIKTNLRRHRTSEIN